MGKIITFYSYKGGTGRSMLLANIAWLLATNGERVLVIDWDLEAPGLHRYFKPFLVDPDMTETKGLIDAFWAVITRALTTQTGMSEQPAPDYQNLANQELDPEDYITPLKWNFHGKGGVDFIGAGLQGATYSERVNTFDWKRFYQLGGRGLLERFRTLLIDQYDFVLIDSRTGVSDTSGICTMQMPDVLVACLTLNRQSIEGVASILDSVRAWRTSTDSLTQGAEKRRALDVYPIATRIEGSEQEKLELARAYGRKLLAPFLPESDSRDLRSYWDDMEVTYRPFYAYEEILASFGDTAGAAGSKTTLLSEMETIGRRVSRRRDLRVSEIPDLDRQRVLELYAFGKSAQRAIRMADKPSDPDKEDPQFLRNVYAKEVVWRKSGYYYRNLLGRRELQLIKPDEQSGFGRQMSFFYSNSQLFPGFRETTNSIFVWFWSGMLGLAGVQLSSLYTERLYDNWRYRDSSLKYPDSSLRYPGSDTLLLELLSPQFHNLLMVSLLIVFAAVIGFRVLRAGRSASKPYGMGLRDVVRLSILGPLARDIEDIDIERADHSS
jgi:cellulose biosynthesis protein BcsQ